MSDQLNAVIAAIDDLNSEDPNILKLDGYARPSEQVYSERMTARLQKFYPNAGEELQIAARAQHVQRWKSSRKDFPEGKAGYYRWRTELGRMHAEVAANLMESEGYDNESVEQVKKLLTKQGIKQNQDVQILEDVICLVFLEFYFLPFAEKHSEPKVIDIVQKTWKKMSERGQQAALQLDLNDEAQRLVVKALNS